MPLTLFNTLTGRKEPFEPRAPGRIGVYVCGPTVYDSPHLGHARAAIVFDVLVRYLRRRFPDDRVVYIRNYTDIDDKIIRRAAETGEPWDRLAGRYRLEYEQVMAALGCLPPDRTPKATDHVPEMVALIERLVAAGVAYVVGGDVYYRVSRFPAYGRLSKRNLDELKAGARVDVDERKADPLDFALWKAAKPGEPAWESPWGPGRPGWHIECSAMSMRYLGERLDIHGGGQDLIFPHHENEIAQSEAATGCRPFARFWVHNGFVNVNAEKMSKSVGNFITPTALFGAVQAEVLRQLLLSVHYRGPIDFSDDLLDEARKTLDYFYTLFARIEQAESEAGVRAGGRGRPVDGAGSAEAAVAAVPGRLRPDARTATGLLARFGEAMDDDLNTPVAFAAMHEAARAANRVADALPEGEGRLAVLVEVRRQLRVVGEALGLLEHGGEDWLKRRAGWAWPGQVDTERGAALTGVAPRGARGAPAVSEAEIERRIAERAEARRARDFTRADAIRRDLEALGVQLEDRAGGRTDWKRT